MKETIDIVNHIREWAVEQVDSKDDFDDIKDRFALIEEYKEWFNPEDEDLEVVSLDEITERQYDDFVEYNDGIERG